jgi:low temperature requirement protein LtrA
MAVENERGALFRAIEPNQHSRVTYAELFFDLVFVFAVTQLSHTLLGHFTPLGAVQTTLLFLAVWWAWVYTNWLNPELTPVRILLFLLMLAGLVLSTSIPHAFEARGLWFASAYAAMQVGRTLFFLLSVPRARTGVRWNAIRILAWLSVSAVFWVWGGFAQSADRRLLLWAIALAIEYAGPLLRFWIPKYGASAIDDWYVEGGHMAERCAGFIIIALGESIVDIGATFADLTWTRQNVAAFASAFVTAIAMWWIYFLRGSRLRADLEIGRVGPAGALCLYLSAHADRGRHHSVGRRGRTRPETSDRSLRPEDGDLCDRRSIVVPGRHHPVQAEYPRLPAAFAWRRHCRTRGAGPVRARTVAACAVGRHHDAPDRRRGVGIAVAAVEDGRIGRGPLLRHHRVN